MSVDLGLKKIATLELEKKNLLLNLLNANELVNKVKTENMQLLNKVKNLELELSIAREKINRSASSKLEHMLSIQKSPLDKTRDRKSTRLNSSHVSQSRMPSSA